MTLAKYRL